MKKYHKSQPSHKVERIHAPVDGVPQQSKTGEIAFNPEVLPLTGKSRWSQIKKFSPVCRETFRRLSLEGRAPKPERLGVRCTFYDNRELHRWLADPINYRIDQ
ncbi:helix-turn-helix transcriptional regulator [Nitrosomonas communis]|uniref:helix-turn-helix transcriptional regulator n=1 Tax=Nitrosomonas communis TaxID=44574 RepID=UPI003D2AFD48